MAAPSPSLPAGFLPGSQAAAADRDWVTEVLRHPGALRWCAEQLERCRLATHYEGAVPALGGGFPQWEFSCDSNGYHDNALRALGRVRAPQPHEEGFEAVVELSFRGTRNIDNWRTNLQCGLQQCPIGAGIGRVHCGFATAYTKLRGEVVNNVTLGLEALGKELSSKTLVLSNGHSLGGALATLAAYDFACAGGTAVCVTWGSPRVGDGDFVEAFRMVVPRSLRLVNKFDPVPRLPPSDSDPIASDADLVHHGIARLLRGPQTALQALGYRHVCDATQIDDGMASSAAHWANVVAAASDHFVGAEAHARRTDHEELVPHAITTYEKNLGKLIDGSDGTAKSTKLLGSALTASVAAASMLSAFRARRGGGDGGRPAPEVGARSAPTSAAAPTQTAAPTRASARAAAAPGAEPSLALLLGAATASIAAHWAESRAEARAAAERSG